MTMTFLVSMLWKSAAIAGVALVLIRLLRAQAPSDRAAVLRIAVIVLLALPLIALAAPALRLAVLPPEPTTPAAAPLPVTPVRTEAVAVTHVEVGAELALPPVSVSADNGTWDNPGPLVAILYFGGVALVMLRMLVGLVTLRRWTALAQPVECPLWLAAFDRLKGQSPRTRLLETVDCGSPLSWGFRSPVILIDRDRIAYPEDAEAILAHEFAHIVRRDWLMLMLMHLATAIFWFNPLVWLLEREAIQQAEEAADAQALARTEPAHYAQMLLSYAAFAMPRMPANCMAPEGGVARRVKAILAHGLGAARPRRHWAWVAMLACVGVAAPISAAKFVAAEAPAKPAAKPSITSPQWAESAGVPAAPAPVAAPDPVSAPAPVKAPKAPPSRVMPVTPLTPVTPTTPVTPLVRATPHTDAYLSDGDRREMARDIAEAQREAQRAAAEGRREAARALAEARREAEEGRREAARGQAEARREAERGREEGLRAAAEGQREATRAQREAMRASAEARTAGLRAAAAEREAARNQASALALEINAQVAAATANIGRTIEVSVRSGLAQGADGMEAGAKEMLAEAQRLHDPAYRQKQIARQAEMGHPVTDQRLLDAIPKMERGAERMKEGAQRMRDGQARANDRMRDVSIRMSTGADRMDDGARRMRETAANLRRADYRKQQIADAAARGETVTDDQLLNAIPGLEEGAKAMERDAARMRTHAASYTRS